MECKTSLAMNKLHLHKSAWITLKNTIVGKKTNFMVRLPATMTLLQFCFAEDDAGKCSTGCL